MSANLYLQRKDPQWLSSSYLKGIMVNKTQNVRNGVVKEKKSPKLLLIFLKKITEQLNYLRSFTMLLDQY